MGDALTPPPPVEFLVAGLARNCERTVERDIQQLLRATSAIGRAQVLIIESDSDDATVPRLKQLSRREPRVDSISLGRLREALPERTQRIAHCRNAYLQALESDARYADVTHLIVADLDGMCADLTPGALASCWRLEVPWAACTANQGDYYYDIWALRHAVWCPGDAWEEFRALQPLLGQHAANEITLFSRMAHISPVAAPIEVESAFGGLAVYQRAAVHGLRYSGVTDNGAPVCEHVPFHAAMRARGHRLFINPALINARRTKHAGRKKFWRTLRRKAWAALRGQR